MNQDFNHTWNNLSEKFPISVFIGPSCIALYALYKKNLAWSAIPVAFIVGVIHSLYSIDAFIYLSIFFVAASAATKVGKKIKKKREENYMVGIRRHWIQVIANGLAPSVFCLIGWIILTSIKKYENNEIEYKLNSSVNQINNNFIVEINQKINILKQFFNWSIVSSILTASSDTFSSEIGILSKSKPRDILQPWRTIPPGCNGGVSITGFFGAIISALLFCIWIGISNIIFSNALIPFSLNTIILFIIISLFGTILDSVLGRIFEYSGWDEANKRVVNSPRLGVKHLMGSDSLDGNQINFLSCFLTGIFGGVISFYL